VPSAPIWTQRCCIATSDEQLPGKNIPDGNTRCFISAATFAMGLVVILTAPIYPSFWRRLRALALCAAASLSLVAPASAKDSLGVFAGWGAFRDAQVPRCYAIAMAEPSKRSREYQPFASVGSWPKRALRNQLHIRLSRKIAPASTITLRIDRKARLELTGGGGDAWAQDRRMDAAIIAAMRSATDMSVSARDSAGRRFTDSYKLNGAATAMDAATLGCARLK
jgi:hypothetical protein